MNITQNVDQIIQMYVGSDLVRQLPKYEHVCEHACTNRHRKCDCLLKFAKKHRIKCLTPYKRIDRGTARGSEFI